jgi:hypothetical protein
MDGKRKRACRNLIDTSPSGCDYYTPRDQHCCMCDGSHSHYHRSELLPADDRQHFVITRIEFWCEHCHGIWQLVVGQHKGQPFIYQEGTDRKVQFENGVPVEVQP